MASFSLGLKDFCASFPSICAGCSEFAITFLENVDLPAFQFLPGGHKADGAVQAGAIVMINEFFNNPSGILQRKGHFGPNALAFEQSVPPLDLPVALRVEGPRPHMAHSAHTDELLEVPGNELGTIVGDDSGSDIAVFLPGPLKDNLHIPFRHGLTDFPMHNKAAVSVQDTAKVVKGSANVEIGHIHMPMLMRTLRLFETLPPTGAFPFPASQQSRFLEHPIDRARTDRHNVPVEHHEGEPAVSLCSVLPIETHNGLPLPGLEPGVPRDPAVVQVDFPVAALPIVELARCQPKPADKPHRGNGRLFRPVAHEIHNGITNIMGDPAGIQVSPRLFLTQCGLP